MPDRLAFYRQLAARLETTDSERTSVNLLLLELADLEHVLLISGPDVHDQILAALAQRFRTHLPEHAEIFHVQPDRFAVILPEADYATVRKLGSRLLDASAAPIRVDGVPFRLAARFGMARYPKHGACAAALGRAAAVALHSARQANAGYRVYDAHWDRQQINTFAILTDLRDALEQPGQIHVVYQPKVDLHTGACTGVEALVRWRHPERGNVSPGAFIPLVEDTALLQPLTEKVLADAFDTQADLAEAGFALTMAVNLSPRSLETPDFLRNFEDLLRFYCPNPERVEAEVTETAIMDRPGDAIRSLDTIRRLGPTIAIDDFGTGQSSLAYLTDLPADTIKIDKSFVQTLAPSSRHRGIVRGTAAMAQDLGMATVAEGVETPAIYRQVHDLGCQAAQGFGIARPMSAQDLFAWLREHNGRAPEAVLAAS